MCGIGTINNRRSILSLVSAVDITGIDFIPAIFQLVGIAVGDDDGAQGFELFQIVDHTVSEEGIFL